MRKISCSFERKNAGLNEIKVPELKALHWDFAKLLELGLSADFVSQLSTTQARNLVKGILYIQEIQKALQGE